jgi:predicted amidohydrolase
MNHHIIISFAIYNVSYYMFNSLNSTHGEVYKLYDKVCKFPAEGWWFSPGSPVSSSNKTDRHYITEIVLKVALNTITTSLTLNVNKYFR